MPKRYYKSLFAQSAMLTMFVLAAGPAFAQNQDPFGGSEVRWPDQPPGAYLNDAGSQAPQYDQSQSQYQNQGQSQIQWLGQPAQQAAAPTTKTTHKPITKTSPKPTAKAPIKPLSAQAKATPTFGDMLKQQQAGGSSGSNIPGFTPVSQQAMQAFQQPMQQMQMQMQPPMQQQMQPQMQQQQMQSMQMQPQMQPQMQQQMQPVQGQIQMSQGQGGAEQIPGFSPVGGGTAGAAGSDIPGFTPSTGMAEVLKNIMPAPGTTIKLPATSPYVTQQQQRRPVARNSNSIGSNVSRTVNNTVNRSINQMLYRGLNSLRF